MSKENVLFSIIGVLLGFIVGFIFANSVNQSGAAAAPSQTAQQVAATGAAPDRPTPADQPNAAMEEVQATIQKARNEPDNFDAQMRAAEFNYQIRRYDEAIQFLTRANQLRPDHYEAIVNLGNVHFDAGRYEAAERWYAAALSKRPDDTNVRTDLGLTFMLREPADLDRAIAEYRRSLAINARHEPTVQNMTVALLRKGDAKEAQAMLARLGEINPGNPVLGRLRASLDELRRDGKTSLAAKE